MRPEARTGTLADIDGNYAWLRLVVSMLFGTLGGVLAISILRNGMNLMQVPSFYVLVVLGVILIAVLALDKHLNRRTAQEPAL